MLAYNGGAVCLRENPFVKSKRTAAEMLADQNIRLNKHDALFGTMYICM